MNSFSIKQQGALYSLLMTVLLPISNPSYASREAVAFGVSKTMADAKTVVESASNTTNIDSAILQEAEEALMLEQYPRAEELLLKALGGGKNAASQSQDERILIGLGEAYLWQGKFDLAAKTIRKAVDVCIKKGSKQVLLAQALDDTAWLDQAIGKQADAVSYCKQALAIWRTALTAPNADLAESIEHMASLEDAAGMFDEAKALYQEALNMRTTLATSAGPDAQTSAKMGIANDLERLAALLQKTGKSNEAQPLFGQALALKESTGAVFATFSAHKYTDNVEFNFLDGAQNCSRGFQNGKQTLTISANGVTVQASVVANPGAMVKTARADLKFDNGSQNTINILPQPAIFMVLSPKPRMAKKLDDQQLAAAVEKKGEKKAKWIRFWGENATTTMTSTMMGNGGYGGPYGYMPPAFVGGNSFGWQNDYRGGQMTTYTTSVPDFQARARAMQKAQDVTEKTSAEAEAIRQTALGSLSIAAGDNSQGSLDFDDSKFRQAILRIPVGNAVFVFPFDRDRVK